jgi:hypothetical protein
MCLRSIFRSLRSPKMVVFDSDKMSSSILRNWLMRTESMNPGSTLRAPGLYGSIFRERILALMTITARNMERDYGLLSPCPITSPMFL